VSYGIKSKFLNLLQVRFQINKEMPFVVYCHLPCGVVSPLSSCQNASPWLESRLSNYPSFTPISPFVALPYLGTFQMPISSQLALLRAQFSKPEFHSFRDFRTVKLTLWRVPPFWPKLVTDRESKSETSLEREDKCGDCSSASA